METRRAVVNWLHNICNRSTFSGWGSYENALSGALTVAAISNAREAIRDNDRGGKMDLIVMPHNQLTNLQALTPTGPLPRYQAVATDPMSQHHFAEKAMFGDAEVFPIGDLINTVLLYLQERDFSFIRFRPLEVFQHDRSGDDDVWQMSTALTLKCHNPQRQGKETGVTA